MYNIKKLPVHSIQFLAILGISLLIRSELLGTSTIAHNSPTILPTFIKLVEWQPNANKFAIADHANVWIYTDTMQEIEHLPQDQVVSYIAWSPNGERLAILTTTNATWKLQIWRVDVQPIQQVLLLENNDQNNLSLVRWSPDGNLLAIGLFEKLQIRDARSGALIKTISGFPTDVSGIAWNPQPASPVANQIITSSGKFLQLWDVNTGNLIRTLEDEGSFGNVVWSPNSNLIAVVFGAKQIQIWNTENAQLMTNLQGHTRNISSLKWSIGGLASSSYDGKIHLWNPNNGQILDTFDIGEAIYTIDFSPDGTKIIYGGRNIMLTVLQIQRVSE